MTRLWRALNNRSVPPDGRLTAQQRRRLRYMLQAVDGHM
ncbi:DNA -binding domain-containing protein, partial [Acinetobacter baumannii]